MLRVSRLTLKYKRAQISKVLFQLPSGTLRDFKAKAYLFLEDSFSDDKNMWSEPLSLIPFMNLDIVFCNKRRNKLTSKCMFINSIYFV